MASLDLNDVVPLVQTGALSLDLNNVIPFRDDPQREAALDHVSRGFSVFRCKVRDKKPDTPNGCKDAIANSDDIFCDWLNHPHANIGVATGTPSGVWVLDIDGEAGEASLAALVAEHGALPETPQCITGSGGRHLFFAYHGEAIKNRNSQLGSHLDVKATGGYVIGAGSVHPNGRTYEWDVDHHPDHVAFTGAPEWLMKLVTSERATPANDVRPASTPIATTAMGYAHAALASACNNIANAQFGRQETTLNGEAFSIGQLVAGGEIARMDAETALIRAGLSMANEPGKPRWIEYEIREKVMRGLDDGAREPRGVPERPRPEPRPARSKAELIECARSFTPDTDSSEIGTLLSAAEHLGTLDKKDVHKAVQTATGHTLGDIQKAAKEAVKAASEGRDLGLDVAEDTARRYYAGGRHIVRADDRSFWTYTGTHWRRVTDERVFNRVVEVVKDVVPAGDRDYRSVADAALRLMSGMHTRDADVFAIAEDPKPVINCRNGELWLHEDGTAELRPHTPESYLINCIPVDYDPAATCPLYDQTLEEIFAQPIPDGLNHRAKKDDEEKAIKEQAEMVRHWNEFAGYLIQPRRFVPSFWMLQGGGSNGKTALVELLTRLLGPQAVYSECIDKMDKDLYAKGDLLGKLMLLDDDVNTGTKLPDGLLKKISERKLITGKAKFKDSFEFIACAVPVMLVNNFPNTADLTWGLMRRAHIIPFHRRFTDSEKDGTRFERIAATELSGVLNRCLEGYKRVRERGCFLQPNPCKTAFGKWKASANPLSAYLEECPVKYDIRTRALYENFVEWADCNGIRNIPTLHQLKSNVVNLGYTVVEIDGYSTVKAPTIN